MRVLIVIVNSVIVIQGSTQSCLGQHSPNCFFQQVRRPLFENLLCRDGFDSSRPTGMVVINFVVPFFTGQFNLCGVDDNDIIPGIDMGV